MKTMVFLVAFGQMVLAGCVSMHQVDSADGGRWTREAQGKFLGEEVDLRTVDGKALRGVLGNLTADSLLLQGTEANPPVGTGYTT